MTLDPPDNAASAFHGPSVVLHFPKPLDVRDALQRSGEPLFVTGVTDRHNEVRTGIAFVGIRGVAHDGADVAAEAANRGASVIIAERSLDLSCPTLSVPHSREAYGQLCHAGLGQPAESIPVIGVTGTDGKTTTTWMLRHVLNRCLGPTALCGTIEIDDGRSTPPASLTTPDASALATWLATAKSNGCVAAVIELSSHALHQRRTAGLSLAAAAVTNIRRDHLDYHGSEENYAAAKASIATLLRPSGHLVIGDVPSTFRDRLNRSDVRLRPASESTLPQFNSHFLATAHNAENASVAVVLAESIGCDREAAIEAITDFPGVPGRWERIDEGQSFEVIVDYAHTPAAVSAALSAAKATTPDGRVFVVCGAGGDRDVGKRPLIGNALSAAEHVFLTADNPRSEIPTAIAAQIAAGLSASFDIEPDRAAAIRSAVRSAKSDDIVLVLGKGHERTQTIGGEVRPFVDQDVCRQALRADASKAAA